MGNREYDSNYVKPILESEINYFDLKTLRNKGIDSCISGFHQMVNSHKLNGFFIHLDVDVLNDNIMPAVDSRQVDGLNYSEFTDLMVRLLSSPKAIGIEITILDPRLDPEGKYTSDFIKKLLNAINIAQNQK